MAARLRVFGYVEVIPALDELAPLDPIQVDAGDRPLFSRRFDVAEMLRDLVLLLMGAGRPPVDEDQIAVGPDMPDL